MPQSSLMGPICFTDSPTPFKYPGSEKNSGICLCPVLLYGGTTLKDKDTREVSENHKKATALSGTTFYHKVASTYLKN